MDCESCEFRKKGKRFPNLDPCRKGHSAFFTLCVDEECRDYRKKGQQDAEGRNGAEDRGERGLRGPS